MLLPCSKPEPNRTVHARTCAVLYVAGISEIHLLSCIFCSYQITHNLLKTCQITYFAPLIYFFINNESAADKLGGVPQLASSPSRVSTESCRSEQSQEYSLLTYFMPRYCYCCRDLKIYLEAYGEDMYQGG